MLAIGTLTCALLALLAPGALAAASGAPTAKNSTRLDALASQQAMPFWHRPGCYRVGHTRTISIPGCLKFNISTHACRGYCMSYSMPANSEPGADALLLLQDLMRVVPGVEAPDKRLRRNNKIDMRHDNVAWSHYGSEFVTPGPGADSGARRLGPHDPSQTAELQQSGDSDAKIVSVSQCCNMMETEDVPVNLRCGGGAHEIRQLVFKSAKTCECFFCKHV